MLPDIACSTAMTKVEHKSHFRFTKDTIYLTLTGTENHWVSWEYFLEKYVFIMGQECIMFTTILFANQICLNTYYMEVHIVTTCHLEIAHEKLSKILSTQRPSDSKWHNKGY